MRKQRHIPRHLELPLVKNALIYARVADPNHQKTKKTKTDVLIAFAKQRGVSDEQIIVFE